MSLQIAGPFSVQVGDYPDTDADVDIPTLHGVILDIGLKHTFDGGSSMDIAITTKGETSPSKDILNLSGSDTDGWFPARESIVDTDGAAISGQYNAGIAVYDVINVAISNAGGGDQLDVWFLLLE